ncbi:MAG TPA: adenylate/guanylate cyclase domain-containing protein [Verrucomicrobiae bacterium]|nr:adenylate/guanylate cyclase domain-containing protein [Verrucomicrobiae bacterium]
MDPGSSTPLAAAWLESDHGARTPVQGTCSLGRAAINDVVLNDDKVSRRHAMINAQSQGEFWLVDLGSANGTYLNERRVTQPCRLTDRDKIAIARHEFVFRAAKPATAAAGERPTETIQDVRTAQCWLLLADIENSTQFLQRLTANDIPRVTGRWLAACKQLVDENKGTINKYLGDGFFAYWLNAEGTSGAVARALKGLRELQGQDGPRFRVVLHFGEVSIGGGASMGEESLMGPQVNFTFRIEKLAGSLGAPCLVSEAANEALESILPTGQCGRAPVNGFPGEYTFFAPQ